MGTLTVGEADTPEDEEAGCYRHKEREAAVRCHRCNRRICQECMIPAPVGFHCPECLREGAKQTRQFRIAGLGTPYVAYVLIAVNVAAALAYLVSTPGWASGATGQFGIDYAILGGGFERGPLGRPVLVGVDAGEWYRIVTGAFLHGGVIHLAFNMLLLWQTGMILEPLLGRVRFGLLYAVALLGGSFGALLVQPDGLSVGASGAVFGLMGALYLGQRMGVMGRQQTSIGFLIVVNLVLTFVIPGISVGGHVGGLAAGAAAGLLFYEYDRRKLSPVVPIVVVAGLGLVLFIASVWAASTWRDPIFG